MMFDKIKKPVYYSLIPGTDAVWRCFKFSMEPKKKKEQKSQLAKIYNDLAEKTGVYTDEINYFKGTPTQGPVMPKTYIQGIDKLEKIPAPEIKLYYPIENVCGTNTVLRKLWFISYYYMYYSDVGASDNLYEYEIGSNGYEVRKRLFHRLKHLHREVLKQWRKATKKVCFECKCKKEDGFHENLSIFMTSMSLPDELFDAWLLYGKQVFVHSEEDAVLDTFVKFAPAPHEADKNEKIVVATVSEYQEMVS
ncbi:unnamed protein product [Caenorhabditis brenneri]